MKRNIIQIGVCVVIPLLAATFVMRSENFDGCKAPNEQCLCRDKGGSGQCVERRKSEWESITTGNEWDLLCSC